jgi:hypothetical protein
MVSRLSDDGKQGKLAHILFMEYKLFLIPVPSSPKIVFLASMRLKWRNLPQNPFFSVQNGLPFACFSSAYVLVEDPLKTLKVAALKNFVGYFTDGMILCLINSQILYIASSHTD